MAAEHLQRISELVVVRGSEAMYNLHRVDPRGECGLLLSGFDYFTVIR